MGGDNLYQYAPNPMGWIDPLGLARSPSAVLKSDMGICGKGQAAHHLIPVKVWEKYKDFLDEIDLSGLRDKASNGLAMPTSNTGAGSPALAHRGNHPQYSAGVDKRLGQIRVAYNKGQLSPAAAKQKVEALQQEKRASIQNKQEASHVSDSGCEILS